MKRTISVMMGKGSLTHNNRDFVAENVDKERIQNDITYCNENIKTVYHALFDEALEKYNAKQTRKADRREQQTKITGMEFEYGEQPPKGSSSGLWKNKRVFWNREDQ